MTPEPAYFFAHANHYLWVMEMPTVMKAMKKGLASKAKTA
jgi:hypothetical protein